MNIELLIIVVAMSLAAGAFAAALGLWGEIQRLKKANAERVSCMEGELKQLQSRVDELEVEVARQGLVQEEQGIRLETQAYWQED